MTEFKIGYISDEHLDFRCTEKNPQNPKFNKQIATFIKDKLKPEGGDILLSGGDTSHYNEQTKEYLTQMLDYYGVIFITDGNHDRYLINATQQDKYNFTSDNRVQEMIDWCETQPNIHFLDGNVVDVEGLKIGGLGNWYDLPTDGLKAQWREIMNDSNLIMTNHKPHHVSYGYGASMKLTTFDTQAHRERQEKNMDNIVQEGCDILLTHIIPAIIPDEHLFSGHVGDNANIFYMSDDLYQVKKTGAEVVVYGHNHTVKEFTLDGIEFKTNAVAYPNEPGAKKIEHFTFIKS